ncbi:probable mitochondrial import inner membrane translocase subunit TIM21 isoform X2 [Brachypodium distachyon]|uniref:Mitochondrial import inner membrane translocase subunit Tim21 n=1 Tax=Brachypodium distachyon TaxID=15368 RepID=A0A0Q3KBU2_BRADI|nr:probable mitochondrial import inner membrane translocase subunit TIM21 isoform X2 [Brachypodium distachyon]KQK08385.1 hypothetical protein BRADI_2g41600v3 [Brachypodium distachyon]|eukprot:XP_014755114.1 probable mitochondrial import inner membrane translocase subunit TIM21 isoform X2 [Brachypodium distachyon]
MAWRRVLSQAARNQSAYAIYNELAAPSPLRSLRSNISAGFSLKNSRWYMIKSSPSNPLTMRECHKVFPSLIRPSASYSTQASDKKTQKERKDLSTTEDPFDDAPTYNIPEKPVTFAEGASYSLVILAGLGVAALAGYAVFKELIFEPKEYKIFGKALARVQSDSQVTARIGYPITGYGSETRNRAARQRVPSRIWTDEEGVEHVEVNFYIRGPHGAGKVYSAMFKDNSDGAWKFTYLLVEFTAPHQGQVMLESYIPA